MTGIALAEGLSLPADAATQVIAFMGKRGSGKTYGAGRLVEQLRAHGDQVVILDPVGTWWGLRLAADGKTPGLEIPVFGGWHGDIPLQATAGRVVAELVAERGTSLVLDVSGFTLGDQRRFVADFAAELFHAKKRHRSPLMVVFEEAQEFAPQHVRGDVAKMVGAVERLVKLGRNFGVGATLISQRPQAVNKDVLNLTEVLCAFQLVGPQERKAIEGWVQEKEATGRDQVGNTLPSLPVGTAMIWSPQWLEHFGRHKLLRKETFDASATPKAGKARPAAALAPIDLDAVKTAMAATIEEAKANDPAALRAEVARLRRELAAAGKAPGKPVEVRVEVVPPAVLRTLKAAAEALYIASREVQQAREHADRVDVGADAPAAPKAFPANPDGHKSWRETRRAGPAVQRVADAAGDGGKPLSRCARAILAILAQRGASSDTQLSILSGYSIRSSSFANALGELRSAAFVAGSRDLVEITTAGLDAAANLAERLPPLPEDGRGLLAYWQRSLGKCERAMLGALFEHGELTRERLAAETAYSITSSSFANAIGKLRSLELVTGSNPIRIAEVFR